MSDYMSMIREKAFLCVAKSSGYGLKGRSLHEEIGITSMD